MTSISLFALLHTSLADIKPGSADHKLRDKHKPEDLSSKTFNDLYRGSWVLFDAVVIVPDDDSQPYTLDMPVFHLGQAIRIEANFAALRQAARQAPANEPVRVIFAAQLERLAPQAGPQSAAVLTLKGQSAFLWTSHDTYAALGYHEDDAEELKVTHAILDHQFEVMKELK